MKKIVSFFLLICLFSCEKMETPSLKDLYLSLPSIKYDSQTYSVNGNYLIGKKTIDPANPRLPAYLPTALEYNNQEIAAIRNYSTNSLIIIYGADTKAGNVCSVYESQGVNNNYLFIDGKLINFPGYSVTDFKITKDNLLILVLNDASGKEIYEIYK